MPSPAKIRFAMFEVDPLSGELRKHGNRIRLQDQPFKILLALLEKPGEVVTREELRQRVWGDGTFVDFDHGLSAAVNRLREALGDSAENPRYIETMARRGYRFLAPVEDATEPEMPAATLGRPRRKSVWAGMASVVAAALGVGLWLAWDGGAAPPPPRVVRLTAFTGVETHPTFSPDGTQVAFAWNGERQDNFDIYVKILGSAEALRLTSDPGIDEYPAWSPDGRQIAFASNRGQSGIYLVSPLGGAERKLADVTTGGRLSWSPDGRFLAVVTSPSEHSGDPDNGAVLLVPVGSSGKQRRILVPKHGAFYWHPTFSPDGRRLAVNICSGAYRARAAACQLHILQLNRELLPEGEPQAIPPAKRPAVSPLLTWRAAWTADGNSLVATASVAAGPLAAPEPWLWRVPTGEVGEPQRLESAGPYALDLAIDPKGHRLAFTRDLTDCDIWRWEPGEKASPFLTSSLEDSNPQFSHDGQRIAFASRRGGDEVAVWLANSDGTGLAQITKEQSPYCGTPRWSPDDRWIAFDAWGANGRWDVWMLEANGGSARRLTEGPADNIIPSWSRDGKWVYFTSTRSGRNEIWRVPAQMGPAEQITYDGGFVSFDSADGKTLYYTKNEPGIEGLFAIPLTGGAEKRVIEDRVLSRGFSIFRDGIYYTSSRDPHNLRFSWQLAVALPRPFQQTFRSNEIRFYEFATGRSRTVAEIEGPLGLGLSVSPDRKTFLFTRRIAEADLMLIENFR